MSDFVRGFSEAKGTRYVGGVQFLTHDAGPFPCLNQCQKTSAVEKMPSLTFRTLINKGRLGG